MRISRTATVTAVFAAVLLAGACQSSSKSAAPAATSPTSAAAPSSAAVDSSAPSAGSDSASGASTASSSKAAAPGTAKSTAANSGVSACQGANLKVTIIHGTDADPVPSQNSSTTAVVSFQNTGSSTCTVQGHPQVDLISTAGYDWQLGPQSGATPKQTLQPGMSALASLTMLPSTPDGGTEAFQVKSARITPPDTKTATTVAWPWTWPLQLQDAATHPGTFIGAVNQTAS